MGHCIAFCGMGPLRFARSPFVWLACAKGFCGGRVIFETMMMTIGDRGEIKHRFFLGHDEKTLYIGTWK